MRKRKKETAELGRKQEAGNYEALEREYTKATWHML
jgi:hypothetical protein